VIFGESVDLVVVHDEDADDLATDLEWNDDFSTG